MALLLLLLLMLLWLLLLLLLLLVLLLLLLLLQCCENSKSTSHQSLRTLHQPSESAPNCLDPLRHPHWPGGMREAMKYGAPPAGAEPC